MVNYLNSIRRYSHREWFEIILISFQFAINDFMFVITASLAYNEFIVQ